MALAIGNVRDLVDAASSGRLAELFPTIDRWLPQMMASSSWSVRLSQHFLLLYHLDGDDVAALDQEAFLVESEQVRKEIIDYFGALWSAQESKEAFKRHLTLLLLHVKSTITFGTPLKPDLLLYLLDTHQDPEYMVKFRHEFTHWLWGSMYGEAPGLFNEGLAVVVETMSQCGKTEADLFRGVRPLDEVPPLQDLCANERFFGQGTALYRSAGTFVYFLSSRWGWDRVAELFRRTDFDDTSIASTFAQVFGISLQEADVRWRDYLRLKTGKYSQG